MKRKIALLIALLISANTFVACTETDNSNDVSSVDSGSEKQDSEVVETAPPETSRRDISDDLPAKNFDGAEFRIYAESEFYESAFYADEFNGDVVNDAMVQSIINTEDRFNSDIVCILSNLGGNMDNTHNAAIRQAITSGDNSFEIAENHDFLSGGSAIEGMFVNYYDLDMLDFSKPWWPSATIENMTYQNQLYLGSCMMSIRGLLMTKVLYFNKDLMRNYNIEEPYETVLAGKWYLDTMIGMTENFYVDSDGDSERDDDDIYGYTAWWPTYTYLESYGFSTVNKSDDALTVGIDKEKLHTLIEKLHGVLFESQGGKMVMYDTMPTFGSGKTLIAFSQLEMASGYLRDSEVNYGIIPTPKFDENQETYLAGYNDRFFVIPITLPESQYEFVGIMIEAMCAEAYKEVVPAYYEIALKTKYSQDNETVKVLDIINDNRVLDFGYCYCPAINDVLVTGMLNPSSHSTDVISVFESREQEFNSTLEGVYEAYQKLAEKTE